MTERALEEQLVEAIVCLEELSFFLEEMTHLPESFNLGAICSDLQS